MTSDTLVLGAGMVGVSIACHLQARGRSVTLVDRRAPGRETSFGNAGLIQREAVQPHPFPRDLANLWRVLPNKSIDVRYRAGAMFSEANPLWQYWRYSAPRAFERIVPEYAALIMRCTAEHEALFQPAGASALVRRDGWLQVFRTQTAFEQFLAKAEDFRTRFGVTYERIDPPRLREMEPDLSLEVVGAVHWTNAWSVIDPGGLVQAYADYFRSLGGQVVQAEATDIARRAGQWHLETAGGRLSATDMVLATGPWSPAWLARLGYDMPMFVMRGYHMHYDPAPGATLHYGIMDAEKGYLLTPKSAGLRLTTGAELNTIDAAPRLGQLEAAEATARQFFALGERREQTPWKGARPCLADMKPVIGPAHRHEGLWFAFGHGHQGFTLGPATGRLIGEMMDGETPFIDPGPYASDRFHARESAI
ncbi:FAD-binding oxidoreductase [Salinisphaera sp. Q1T1-3]|uniref:NAD(P)/FAD-dependent oxidoreductase n=1 Tax=Salinisphaera sp. Q1T1-3 TaxID=2321229 RepID=UPI000E739C3D|nr:FAD-dependent oxidoreductase [Salinisphaera sp. Q1T1-3]RJS95212.1 FAD-binding oxidoreductase [Salinisphaera sp. Q1T1-3]